ncbi:TIGR02206 family membrane protein [Lottiidibacillus patelloidae]|uniref:TIGR02206 family membrane protein n=1 Tax=Lottiidibacillus patelloidae TaxID=2670334 RepID=A0A263BQT5_9BACI|nr:TIGR02206 family membrane protein [Lottiidibacillus patelloidae]OZM56061.1 TIGR02206 family membrane protein [Lottiidibacillus patelloidae]
MNHFFSKEGGLSFEVFGIAHIITIATLVFTAMMIYFFRVKLRGVVLNKVFRFGLAITLILVQFSFYFWQFYHNQISLQTSLPLNLCAISIFLAAYMLWTKSYALFEVLYFWALAGALQAYLTPELFYGYDHFRYYQFFIGHGLIIIAPLFMCFIHQYRPTFRSLIKAFVTINLYALFVYFIDVLVEANYLLLRHKPKTDSLLDFFGPWPYYILVLEVAAIILFTLLYVPFLFSKNQSKIELENELNL